MIDKFELKKDIRRNDKNLRSIEEKESGITLIALVITIVLNCSYLAMERMLNKVNVFKI